MIRDKKKNSACHELQTQKFNLKMEKLIKEIKKRKNVNLLQSIKAEKVENLKWKEEATLKENSNPKQKN